MARHSHEQYDAEYEQGAEHAHGYGPPELLYPLGKSYRPGQIDAAQGLPYLEATVRREARVELHRVQRLVQRLQQGLVAHRRVELVAQSHQVRLDFSLQGVLYALGLKFIKFWVG